MTMGRPPKPTHLKVLEGNPGKRALNKNEPRPQAKIPSCPKHLDKEAKVEWKRISKQLLLLGLLTEVDRAALAAYCQAWSRWIYAEEKINRLVELENQAEAKAVQLALEGQEKLGELTGEIDRLGAMQEMMGTTATTETRLVRLAAETANLQTMLDAIGNVGGLIKTTDKGYAYVTPWMQISNAQQKLMHAFLTEFGMTPAARTRIQVKPPEKVDEYEAFKQRKASSS